MKKSSRRTKPRPRSSQKKNKQFFMVKAAKRWKFPAMGILLLPLLMAAWVSVWEILRSFPGKWLTFGPVLAGIGAYGLFQWLFRKPMGLYVFGHELTHALAAFLSGYRVRSFKVSSRGGSVVLSGTNMFVALAPYCIPIYTLIVVAVSQAIQYYAPSAVSPPWCAFGIGFTFAFHAALTTHALRQHQPDLQPTGAFFSFGLIAFCNALVLVLILKVLFPRWISLTFFISQFAANTLLIFDKIIWLIKRMMEIGN